MAQPLKITIIGAGLSGLLAARVLRSHHAVTVLERHAGNHEVGAALGVGPTATKILEQCGFRREIVGGIPCAGARTFDKDGRCVQQTDFGPLAQMAGSTYLFCHRADLWNEVLRLATCSSMEGQSARVIWAADVVGVDVDCGRVKLADGRTIDSDLVIGADGIKSTLRPLVVGQDELRTARPSGMSAFRFTMPAQIFRALHPEADLLDSRRPSTIDIHLAMDWSRRSVVVYPCRDFALLNVVCIVPDSMIGKETTESWTAAGTREDVLRCFDDYGSFLKDIFRQAEDIKLWQLRDQDPLPTYTKGRAVLIGDAAHAMTPHQGQGATQSIEDAEGLVLFNQADVTSDSVPEVLKDFDRVRRQRASLVQNYTRESHENRSPEDIFKRNRYCWTYDGVEKCLRRLRDGEEMIPMG